MHHQYSVIICQLSDIKSHNQMISKNGANPSLCEIFNTKEYYYANTRSNGKIHFLKAIIYAPQAMAS